MPTVTIAVQSDNRLFCEGILRILRADSSFVVIGHDGGAALPPTLRGARPQVLLVDSRIDGALELCAAIQRAGGPAVIFVGAPDDDAEWALEALAAGARGVLAKSARPEDLVNAVRAVDAGGIWARRHVIAACLRRLTAASPAPRPSGAALLERRLSGREREVFREAAAGLSNKELAQRLAVSEATVKVHLTHIFRKLNLHGRTELAAAYHGLAPSAAESGSLRPPQRIAPRAAGGSPKVVSLKA
jgi:two-component system, NarL family, nitrate/nitrite response regulator NarL